jgi:hypothetical protein
MLAIRQVMLIGLIALLVPAVVRGGAPVPDIELAPSDSLTFELAAGDTAWSEFTIRNVGEAPLDFRLGIPATDIPILSPPPPGGPPITVSPRQGRVEPGAEQEIRVRFDATHLVPGFPLGVFVVIESNDPDEATIGYVVILTLLPFRPLVAELNLKPNHLDTARGGPWITASIELPTGFNPSDILVETVRLQGVAPPAGAQVSIKDHDHDDVDELSVRFDRAAVAAAGYSVSGEVEVTGFMRSGRPFIGHAGVPGAGRRAGSRLPSPADHLEVPTSWSRLKYRLR